MSKNTFISIFVCLVFLFSITVVNQSEKIKEYKTLINSQQEVIDYQKSVIDTIETEEYQEFLRQKDINKTYQKKERRFV